MVSLAQTNTGLLRVLCLLRTAGQGTSVCSAHFWQVSHCWKAFRVALCSSQSFDRVSRSCKSMGCSEGNACEGAGTTGTRECQSRWPTPATWPFKQWLHTACSSCIFRACVALSLPMQASRCA